MNYDDSCPWILTFCALFWKHAINTVLGRVLKMNLCNNTLLIVINTIVCITVDRTYNMCRTVGRVYCVALRSIVFARKGSIIMIMAQSLWCRYERVHWTLECFSSQFHNYARSHQKIMIKPVYLYSNMMHTCVLINNLDHLSEEAFLLRCCTSCVVTCRPLMALNLIIFIERKMLLFQLTLILIY